MRHKRVTQSRMYGTAHCFTAWTKKFIHFFIRCEVYLNQIRHYYKQPDTINNM